MTADGKKRPPAEEQKKRQPDHGGRAPPPPRPRRVSSNEQQKPNQQYAARNLKENEQQKVVEDAATRLAQTRSLQKDSEETTQPTTELIQGDHAEQEEPSPRPLPRRTTTPTTTNNQRVIQPAQALPGAFRMRPSQGATPALGLEEGERSSEHHPRQESRRELAEKEETTLRDGDDVLIEAQLVSEDGTCTEEMRSSASSQSTRHPQSIYPEPELIMGEPVSVPTKPSMERIQEEGDRARRLRWIMAAILLLLVFLVVAVVALVVVMGKDKNEKESSTGVQPTGAILVLSEEPPFTRAVLPDYTQQALDDPESPQSQAYNWLLQELGQTSLDSDEFFPLQRMALATLYYSTEGSNWINNDRWMQDQTDPCDWYTNWVYGSICTNQRRRSLAEQAPPSQRSYYEALSLYQNNLVGTLPPELGLLTTLDVVDLHGNNITGTIPSQLGLWKKVTHLQLFNNSLTGTLPKEIRQLSQIRHLNFAFNQLSGSIPGVELSQLAPTMEVFSVSNNRIKGTIPTELGWLSRLEGLHLYSNPYLEGTVPSEFGRLSSLLKLHLNGIGRLSGTIPTELGLLGKAQEIQLHDTQIQGPIPSSLGTLTKLTTLSMYNTKLTGSVPTELGLMSNLESLYLAENPHLGGVLPSELGQLNLVLRLYLNGIELLTGTIPTELGALSSVQEIQLHDTQLQGTIPSFLGRLSTLTRLSLHNTLLTGTVPEEICNLTEAGTLQMLSIDCIKVQCPSNCKCDCEYDGPLRYEAGAAAEIQPLVVVEAITDPPITVSGAVDDPTNQRPGDHQLRRR